MHAVASQGTIVDIIWHGLMNKGSKDEKIMKKKNQTKDKKE